MKDNLYNFIEKDFWRGGYTIEIRKGITHLSVPINYGWNLNLEDWEIGQICGGN